MKTLIRAIIALLVLLASLAPVVATQTDPQRPKKPGEKSALDHLRAARSTLNTVKPETLTTEAAAAVKDIGKRLGTLEQSYVSHGKKTTSQQETPSGSTRVRIAQDGNWSAQVPDIDKLLGSLISSSTPIARQQDGNVAVTRKLMEVRSHLTAFATNATGTSGPPR
jgi:hypothetical protein